MGANPTTLTLQAGVSQTNYAPAPPGTWRLGDMRFDAWLRLGHSTGLTITQHPVETGANITDHSFVNPKRFTFDIGVTDVLTVPSFAGTAQKRHINAYNELVRLQETKTPLPLVSKYNTYRNILVESVNVFDDRETTDTLRAAINLMEIIIADVEEYAGGSLNPQATAVTNRGQIAPQQPNNRWYPQIKEYLPWFIPGGAGILLGVQALQRVFKDSQ